MEIQVEEQTENIQASTGEGTDGEAAVQKWKLPRVGWRMIKTMISATLIVAAYSLWDRNPCFACIGAVFGMGNVMMDGMKSGGNRFIGTIMGGVIALLFYPLYHDELWGVPGWIYLTAGLLILLYIGEMLGAIGGIQPGSVVFYVVILTVPETSFVTYTVNRMIDTGIGVALSLLIDRVFPSPKEEAPIPIFGRKKK